MDVLSFEDLQLDVVQNLARLKDCSLTNPPFDIIYKFSLLITEDGNPFFYSCESDRKFFKFFTVLSACEQNKFNSEKDIIKTIVDENDEFNQDNEINQYNEMKDSNEQDVWENEDEEDETYYQAKQVWEKISKKKQKMIITSMIIALEDLLRQQDNNFENQKNVNNHIETIDTIKKNNHIVEPNNIEESQSVNETDFDESHTSINLFSRNFDWKNLPPALQEVYDKQGHRKEVIDADTFWKFLDKCTMKEYDDESEKQNSEIQDTDESAYITEDEEVEENKQVVGEEHTMEYLRGLFQDTIKKKNEILKLSENTNYEMRLKEQREKQEEINDIFKILLQSVGEENTPENIQQLEQILNLMAATPQTPEKKINHKQTLDSLVNERINDVDRRHLGELWKNLLEVTNEEVTEQKNGKTFKIKKLCSDLRLKFCRWRIQKNTKETTEEHSEPPRNILVCSE